MTSTAKSTAKMVVDLNKKKLIHVLFVDDELGFLDATKQTLEMEGPFQVDTASSVHEAIEKMKNKVYDAIISDYQTSEKDGLEFLNELRDNGNTVPFIIFTSKGREEVAIRALNLDADQYLNKTGGPQTVCAELAHTIREAVEKRTAIETREACDEYAKISQELRDSREKLSVIFESAPDAYYLNDLKGTLIDGNRAAERITGYGRNELIGKSFLKLKLLSRNELLKAAKLLAMNAMGKATGPDEFALNRKDGTKVLVEIRTFPEKIKGKTVILGIARDITERKKTEKLILENQRKFEGLFMSNPEATVYLDPSFHVLDANPRFERLFGYPLKEVRGKHINEVVVPKHSTEEAEMLDKKAVQGYVYHDTVRMRKDGSLVPVSVSAAPIFNQDELMGYVGMYKDISQLKKTERDLQVAMKRLEIMNEKLRVVGSLTRHDARNKLSVITGNAYMARRELSGRGEIQNYLKEMEASVQQVTRIFDFAKAYEMLGVEEPVYVDVRKTVDEAISLFSGLKDVKVINDCHRLTLLADSLLRQLFYNLIDNSLKYGQKITNIRIHYEKTGQNELKLIYEDDGVGIPTAEKPRLFKEGYSTGGSTGYGLYMIKKMAEGYGWRIEEAGEPGKGVQFAVTIPKMNQNGKENYDVG